MGRIKSAWEIALERTENIEVDAEKIRHSANIEAIRKIAGAYLLSDEDTEESTREKLLQYGSDDKREALGQTIINALSLPQEEKSDDKKAQRLSFLLLLFRQEMKYRISSVRFWPISLSTLCIENS